MEPVLGGVKLTSQDRAEPILRAGNSNCGGCGMSIGLNLLSLAAANHPVQMVIPACCAIVTAGAFPRSAYGAPVLASTFASAAAMATGLAHAARLNGEKTRVVCWAGDGGTYDIGLATLSAAAERNEDLLYVCYDNEIYGNTGGQRSSATPRYATTSTTPSGKDVDKKDIVGVLAAHAVPYAATLSLGHLDDAMRKFRHALVTPGFRFLHLLSPCPTGWKSDPAEGVDLVRHAVKSGLYPVYEVFDGSRWTINVEPEMSRESLEAYVLAQGRYKKGAVDAAVLEGAIERQWERLYLLAGTARPQRKAQGA
jgi:pyruvate/2-oxoacid:ferredoxin oxidoreductase beta subunit